MSQMTCKKMTIIALAGVSVQTIGLSLFVLGFFPVKPALSGVSGPESYRAPASDFNENHINISLPPRQVRSLYQELSGIRPLYDRLILMVIDGLPAEFVLGKDGKPPRKAFMEAMPYTQSLLANGMALGYHAKAAPPTVTMPRLKAMVSGAIGGFLDVAFNFNTQAMLDDNLLVQFLSIGWKMVMHGDETWLKLFPGLFTRHDGVSSFFVKDTVQVDQNVTRHLGDEFSRDDWNLLILHYLGLDHVGHIGGRNSLLMSPKLAEMDEIVKMIHSSFLTQEDYQRTLLVVVSDHGMTENGNHGGSSFEETDSLALFVGLRGHASDYTSATENTVQQVDIAPTLALLFGVPIPKNNVGVVISKTLDALKDDHQLRALELNSWQLFRLLEAQISGLSCANIPLNGFSDGPTSGASECNGSIEKILCCLYMNAAVLHSSWKSNKVSQSCSWEDYDNTVAAYHNFLKTASEWLSSRCTDKPVDLLAFGVAALLLSCVILLSLILHMCREDNLVEKLHHCHSNNDMRRWYLDEIFVLGAIFILVISMLSSSMVEEEHYIWHFMTSTLFMILLRKTVQLLPERNSLSKGQNTNCKLQMCSVFVLLVSGRILRGWHQGGVNWTYLPDISKWLENTGSDYVKTVQLVSGVSVMCLGFYALSLLSLKKNVVLFVGFNFLVSGLSVLLHIMKYQEDAFGTSNYGATTLAQMIYAVLGSTTVSIVVFLPWFMPIQISKVCSSHNIYSSTSVPGDVKDKSPLMELRDSLYLIGWAYIFCWCLLQLLLQQPINAMPMLLLLVQIVTSLLHFSYGGQHHKEWVEICALYFLGMTGHFALGNSNTLATIDVAGAFIGISSHSTLLSGILMFMITYASPLLVLLSMVIYMSVKNCLVTPQNLESGNLLKTMLGFPCLVPLSVNSILLTAYTLVLLLMRNHLFVWSVFSPKYLYVCATTFCIYIGVFVVAATGTYTFVVLDKRKLMQVSIVNDKR